MYAHAEMDALARQAEARQRISARDAEAARDMRRATAASARSRSDPASKRDQTRRKTGGGGSDAVSMSWFSNLVRSDDAYAANR